MPKILRIHNRLIIGGPTLNVLHLTKFLAPEYETLLIAGEREVHEKDASHLASQMGIEAITIADMGRAVHPFRDYKAFKRIRGIIRDFRPDIVHTHAAKPGAVGRLAASSEKTPVIVHTYHGHVFHSYFNKFKTGFFINTERYLAQKTDAIIAISNQQKKELVEDFRIAEPGKFRTIPLGFELGKFLENREEKRNAFRMEFGLADHQLAIGIIGRLVPVKNHGLFLKAVSYVLKNSPRDIKAFIIGDGITRKELEQKARNLGISFTGNHFSNPGARLIFTSWREDIDTVYAGLDIITLTSLNEGTPVSLIEAQASGKPVVTTRVGGIEDVVLENQTALLSELDDPLGFEKNLLDLVENDELRNRLGTAGAGHVLQKFSVERLVSDMDKVYRELLSKNRRN